MKCCGKIKVTIQQAVRTAGPSCRAAGTKEDVSVAKYKCSVCGYIFEETESKKFEDLKQCPVCKQPASVFVRIEEEEKKAPAPEEPGTENALDYPPEYVRRHPPAAIWQRSIRWRSQESR